ncbi:MAG TPA: DedA family protein [Thermomicrobiales bacterium]|jgi:membrane protein DedA with SNARE-associated domain
MLQDLAHLLEQFLTDYGYLAIFVLMFVEEAGLPLPLPNEVALMYVGYLAYQGKLDANLAGLVATLGAAAGSALLYTIARRGGRRLIHRFGKFIHVTDERLSQAENAVARWGPISIPIARLTPGLRIATTIVSGVLRVSYRVVIVSVVGVSLVWSYFWVHLGRLLGDRWEEGAQAFERAGRWGIVAIIAIVAIVLLVRWLLQRRKANRDEASPSPTVISDDNVVDPDDPERREREPIAPGKRGDTR